MMYGEDRGSLRSCLQRRLIICCGSGGVGKTTIAAALALQGALEGRQALVITIDPARRLATSLGLSHLSSRVSAISPQYLAEHGLSPKGRLFALMLDAQATIDELIKDYVPSEEWRQRIFRNRLYQNFAGTFAGALDYIAAEKLYQLYRQGDFDLIVVDTPPSQQALDFFESPQKILNFLHHLGPYINGDSIWIRLLARSFSRALKTIEAIIGKSFLAEITDFLGAFGPLFEGIRQRIGAVKELLTSEGDTTVLLITSPLGTVVAETISLYHRLRDYRLPLGGLIINKIHDFSSPEISPWQLEQELQARWPQGLADQGQTLSLFLDYLQANYRRMQIQSQADRQMVDSLRGLVGDLAIYQIPYFSTDIADIEGLKKINEVLFPCP